ncbi:unnamed protein product [Clonostachys rhizophaga]|uniref:Uncharacterized protein n=1 Tax=Clonostachys rhizophaga TaxID=160324 RepID=A0A9N9VGU4_9HYPO|nr:unnamed protein product [Clonostachys rhizophaga]
MGTTSGHALREEDSHDVIAGYLQVYDSRTGSESQGSIPIWEHQFLKIGRDAKSNTFSIDSDPEFTVSRNHCEIYVVVYETSINHVYVRDRKSINGTYVNGTLIGVGPNVTPGYLLDEGDEIELRPYWKFKLFQTDHPRRHEFTRVQSEECKFFADRYLVTNRCLGEGAEACVHLATDTKTKKQLVCKVVNLQKLRGRDATKQVQRRFQEVDILRQLHHPNILSYVDCMSSPHTLYTFTELASGGDLMSFIYRHNSIDEFDVRIIIWQVTSGLQFLHTRGVVHRDLKPENILLAFSPKLLHYRVMLSDFGTSSVPRRNRMTSNVGTASYQAPELVFGSIQTSAVDIWSMGIITLILLVPPTDDQLSELIRLDQEVLDEYLSDLNEKLTPRRSSKSLHFVRRCLRINPEERLTTALASSHPWLSTPEKQLKFFQQLDEKMLAEWQNPEQFRPMPLALEDSISTGEFNHDPSPGRGSEEHWPVRHGSLTKSHHFDDTRRGENHCYKHIGTNTAENYMDQMEFPGQKVDKAKTSISIHPTHDKVPALQLSAKRRRITVAKHGDALFLPLTGLQKHLQPPLRKGQREQVLEALKKTNSKFLTDQDHSISDPYTLPPATL